MLMPALLSGWLIYECIYNFIVRCYEVICCIKIHPMGVSNSHVKGKLATSSLWYR